MKDDIDRLSSRAKVEGAKIISAPEDGFWDGRIYRVLDHAGHQWEISQRGVDAAAEHWQLPPGVRRGVAKRRSPTTPFRQPLKAGLAIHFAPRR